MNDYFVGIKFEGLLTSKNIKHLKKYYNLKACDLCDYLGLENCLTMWIRDKSVVECFLKIGYILKVLTEGHHLTIIDCEVNKF